MSEENQIIGFLKEKFCHRKLGNLVCHGKVTEFSWVRKRIWFIREKTEKFDLIWKRQRIWMARNIQ